MVELLVNLQEEESNAHRWIHNTLLDIMIKHRENDRDTILY